MQDNEISGKASDLIDILNTRQETGYINGRASRLPWLAALLAIRDMPFREQDNMISANMRMIAADAIAADTLNRRTTDD